MSATSVTVLVTFRKDNVFTRPFSPSVVYSIQRTSLIAVGCHSGDVYILDLSSKIPLIQNVLLGHATKIVGFTETYLHSESMTQLSRVIVSASMDGQINTWNLYDGRCIISNQKSYPYGLAGIAATPSTHGHIVCWGHSREIRIVNTSTLEVTQILTISLQWVMHVCFVRCQGKWNILLVDSQSTVYMASFDDRQGLVDGALIQLYQEKERICSFFVINDLVHLESKSRVHLMKVTDGALLSVESREKTHWKENVIYGIDRNGMLRKGEKLIELAKGYDVSLRDSVVSFDEESNSLIALFIAIKSDKLTCLVRLVEFGADTKIELAEFILDYPRPFDTLHLLQPWIVQDIPFSESSSRSVTCFALVDRIDGKTLKVVGYDNGSISVDDTFWLHHHHDSVVFIGSVVSEGVGFSVAQDWSVGIFSLHDLTSLFVIKYEFYPIQSLHIKASLGILILVHEDNLATTWSLTDGVMDRIIQGTSQVNESLGSCEVSWLLKDYVQYQHKAIYCVRHIRFNIYVLDIDFRSLLESKDQEAKSIIGYLWDWLHPNATSEFKLCLCFKGVNQTLSILSSQWFEGANSFTCSPFVSAYCSLLGLAIAKKRSDSIPEENFAKYGEYYSKVLPQVLGKTHVNPLLSFLVKYYEDPNNDIQYASRVALTSAWNNLTSREKSGILEYWKQKLETATTPKSTRKAVLTLGILFSIDAASFDELDKKNTGERIVRMFLDEPFSYESITAGDILGRCCSQWRAFIDLQLIVEKFIEWISSPPTQMSLVSAHVAKHCFLQFYDMNSHDVTATLMQISIAKKNVTEKISAIRVLNLLIVKKPSKMTVFVASVIELCLKLLDPNETAQRDACLPFITSVLGDIVKTYPFVAFHKASQRIFYGTNEGHVIIYDLKTATKSLTVDAHSKSVSFVSVSPEGKHMLTISIDENSGRLWSVPNGLLGGVLQMANNRLAKSHHLVPDITEKVIPIVQARWVTDKNAVLVLDDHAIQSFQ